MEVGRRRTEDDGWCIKDEVESLGSKTKKGKLEDDEAKRIRLFFKMELTSKKLFLKN